MADEAARHARPRPRRATPTERRAERATVEDLGTVLDAAARLLEARPRAVAEVRRRLVDAGYGRALVDRAVERLLGLGYLDDEAFARTWVESRDRARPRGEHALRRELALKGVDRAVVDGVLEARRERPAASAPGELDPVDPDEVAAERLLARRLPAILREPDPRHRRRKAYALLARNGFSPDVCRSVAARLLADPESGADAAEAD